MKILLLGEVSGVHRELRTGLERLGHNVVQAHTGDSYRQFSADVSYQQVNASPRDKPLTFARQLSSQVALLPKMRGFDVVQFISPKFFHWRLQEATLRWLKSQNGAVVMVNVSCSSEFNRFMREQEKTPCAECKRFDLVGGACPWERDAERRFEERVYRSTSALVATHYWYHEPIRRLALGPPLFKAPLPIDLDGVQIRPPRVEGPLRVYYGETRHGFKGGEHIKAALTRIARDHRGDFEVVSSTRIPFQEYLRTLDTIDVLIDQANSAGMGMNALYAMARGKVALTGTDDVEMRFVGAQEGEVPALGICADAEQIYGQLLSLAANRQTTAQRGLASRAFIERFHASDVIAARYIDLYAQVLRRPINS